MSTSTLISRFTSYFKRNGLTATVRRIGIASKRALFSNRAVLFYCDIPSQSSPTAVLPSSIHVERKRNQADVKAEDLQQITCFWHPKLAQRQVNERFGLRASLWLIRFQGKLAGYGWTLQGRTVEPHYLPLGKDDVQFFDFHVFPKYRGRGIDWFLMTHILQRLAAEGGARAFGEAAEWNTASLCSFAMTPFRRLGLGKKFSVLGRTIVWWAPDQGVEEEQKFKKAVLVATAPKR